jgi:hypothetical protein
MLKEIKFFHIHNSYLILNRLTSIEFWVKNNKIIEIQKNNSIEITKFSNFYFSFFSKELSKSEILSYENNFVKEISDGIICAIIEPYIAYYDVKNMNYKMFNFLLDLDFVNIEQGFGNKNIISGNYLFSNTFPSLDNEIFCIDTESVDKIKWQITFDEKYRAEIKISLIETKIIEPAIFKFIGVYNNLLWLVLKTGHILALDVETGKEVHSLLYPSNTNIQLAGQQVNYVFETKYSRLDSKNGKIVGFYHFYYWEIDLNNDPNANFIVYSWESDSKEHNIVHQSSHGCYWEGDYIYFYQAERDKKIGIFSRSQRKLVWSGIVEELQSSIAKIAYYDGNILIHDNAHNLHFIPTEFIP